MRNIERYANNVDNGNKLFPVIIYYFVYINFSIVGDRYTQSIRFREPSRVWEAAVYVRALITGKNSAQ